MNPIHMMLDGVTWKACPPPNEQSDLPYVTHEGVLTIMDRELKCVVLNTGERLFTEESLMAFFEIDREQLRALLKQVDPRGDRQHAFQRPI